MCYRRNVIYDICRHQEIIPVLCVDALYDDNNQSVACDGWRERDLLQPEGPDAMPSDDGLCQRCKIKTATSRTEDLGRATTTEDQTAQPTLPMESEDDAHENQRAAEGRWSHWCGGWTVFLRSFCEIPPMLFHWVRSHF